MNYLPHIDPAGRRSRVRFGPRFQEKHRPRGQMRPEDLADVQILLQKSWNKSPEKLLPASLPAREANISAFDSLPSCPKDEQILRLQVSQLLEIWETKI